MDYIIKTKKLRKQFGMSIAVDDISLHVERGSIYGFLGENGAGKTTTIRMLMRLIEPTNGEVFLFGERLEKSYPSIFSKIGTIIETPGLYENLSARDNLRICCTYMGVQDDGRIERTLTTVGLEHTGKKKFKDFSLGMKQRLGIARALVHDPELLILDEPTNGLDPSGIKEIRQLLKKLCEEQGKTILISSHILSEIQQLATHIGIIHNGKLLAEDRLSRLEEGFEQYTDVKVDDAKAVQAFLYENMKQLKSDLISPQQLRIFSPIENTAMLNRQLIDRQFSVYEIHTTKQTLEEYFLTLISGEGGRHD
ncbi:ABC transporter ATP-binding protein [Paenibacillus polymyxa]|uniref:Bacitracin transport ATP-binding protein bcrA n=1 Tax=Paenibacillus polymyxa TaxID=1406 RepID=A0A378Y5P9_PAEPO|nr:ABC transporter ATP-binding protein [Paenibacillus polymyxa]MBE7899563.1 ABC transporter ATP-binding protein [Paenibacillus polymyxa]MBG9762287.1 bacitracin ABC transporter ATP-binding protein [Paenibacillus polymyxa]MCC3258746.1 ABC transporter ATP-binding protein [Paenibacillus polymyxa]QPK52893.1 ABC transporter ATP-binding protein [Paenibacillus polymyxa]UOD86514.1 ABC transporter ATP-binding protein [Paenibacillus polymyxa ATCC 842]